MKYKKYSEINRDYFRALVNHYGDKIEAVDWGSEKSQNLRFDILYEAGIKIEHNVLDVGCGRGDFYSFLRSKGFKGTYQGIDLTPEMIEIASNLYSEKYFEMRDLLVNPYEENQFDFVIASGIFYLRINDNRDFFHTMVRELFRISKCGCAFNCLSSLASAKEPDEFYFDPSDLLRTCQTITPYVTIRHDYKPNDLTIYMYKSAHV